MLLEKNEPIAIIGIGCRFPGGANDPESYWQLLLEGRDAIGSLTERWALLGVTPNDEVPRWAGLVNEPVDGLDAPFFGISPREARTLDPQQRLLLEVSWEALEHAGIVPKSLMGSAAGVFVGACSTDYAQSVLRQPLEEQDAYSSTGNMLSVAAGRLSYTLGLQGPCLTVDTACSSSLVSVHLACRSLRAQECNLALAGGVNLIVSADTMAAAGRLQALSPDGRCKTFDASANGFARGEGCGIIVLKRLRDAERDGDRIWAVIRGSATNQDGRSTGLTAPNVRAQEDLLVQALQNARVEPNAVGFVETHGTGTSLGDPIEVEALRATVGKPRADGTRCVLGAVKTNLGHLEGAAGIAGLIKAVLVLDKGQIPQNLHLRRLNPRLRLEGTALSLPTETIPWPRTERSRFAGVSSLGLSGTNAHVVLEEAPVAKETPGTKERTAELFVLSARSAEALHSVAKRLALHTQAHVEIGLSDLAFSLSATRSAWEQRIAITAKSREELQTALELVAAGQTPPSVVQGIASTSGKVAFLFTGQGAQLPGMGQGLHGEWPVFAEAFDRCTALFDRELGRSLRGLMWAAEGSPEAALLDQTMYTQPALFVLEYALSALWQSWGVVPDLVAGHSIGEIAAACVAGVFSLEDAVKLVAARGRLMQELPEGGVMRSVEAPVDEITSEITASGKSVAIAAVNGPEQVVIAGTVDEVTPVYEGLEKRGVRTKSLPVSHAFHSPLMDPMLDAFAQVAVSVTYHMPTIPFVSNLRGKLVTREVTMPSHWVVHVREAVRFADGVKALHEAGATTFLEIGPRPVLLGMVPRCLPDAQLNLVASSRSGRAESLSILDALGVYWAHGGSVNWAGVWPGGRRRTPLPTYPWQRQRYWVEKPVLQGRLGGKPTGHPLLGVRIPAADREAVFEAEFELAQQPWLSEHRVAGRVVVPGAALAELILAAAAHDAGGGVPRGHGLLLQSPVVVPENGALRVHVLLAREDDAVKATVYSQLASNGPGTGWTQHTTARLEWQTDARHPQPLDLAALRARCGEEVDVASLYAKFVDVGLLYGPVFQGLRAAWRGQNEALAKVALPVGVKAESYGIHPALLDAAFHAMAAIRESANGELLLPFEMGTFVVLQPGVEAAWVHVQLDTGFSANGAKVDVTLADDAGNVVAQILGLQLQRADRQALQRARTEASSEAFYRLEWRQTPLVSGSVSMPAGTWVIVASADFKPAAFLMTQFADCVLTEPAELAMTLDDLVHVTGVVCLWEPGPDESIPEAAQRLAADALSVIQTLQGRTSIRLWWVTTNAMGVFPGHTVNLATAPIWGLGRTVMQEHPELGCTLVDLGSDTDAPGHLVQELTAVENEDQIAWRGEHRYVARLVRAAETDAGKFAIPAQSTVLITGGLGALGQHVARWLAGQGIQHLVLTGRRGSETPGAAQFAEELAALGTKVTLTAVDVADRQTLARVLEAIPADKPLRGIIHAAGVLDDGVLTEQTPERLARVFSPKVTGAWNLHELAAGHNLEFFVLFSSMAGLVGSAGQGNYGAANAFLDALAAYRQAQGLPAQSLAWGPWAEVGMAAELGAALQTRLNRQGIKLLSPTEGVSLLGQTFGRPEPQLMVVPLDRVAMGQTMGQGVPPVWRALVRRVASRITAIDLGAWSTQLNALPWDRRADEVRRLVQENVARVLSFGSSNEVVVDRPLKEMGLDSLMAVELRNALGQRLGRSLPATLAFDYPTVDALTQYLLKEIVAQSASVAVPKKSVKPLVADEPIAIVGMACRYPGGVIDPESFWRLLDEGIDAVTEMPRERWDVDALYDPDPEVPGKMMTRQGGFVANIDQFDPDFFGITPREAVKIDPQQRLLVETSWEALESAGIAPDRWMGSEVGVFVGLMYQEYGMLGGGDLKELDGYVGTGSAASVASGRLSYLLGLTGPSLTVDTACSSSLVTVHLACQALRRGECSAALAGGVALMLTPTVFVEFSRLRGLAPDGRSKSFSAKADGVGWSEGCGMLVLKRLSDAKREGDPILAVILGSAVNQDGRSNGLTAPNGPSQQAVIRKALDQAGVEPADVGYVECHGTGTRLGDPIEVQALGTVLAEGRDPDRPVVIGSVKSNMGHTQAAAGVAGIIKTILSFEHERIPKSLHFDVPSPHIPWADLPVEVAANAKTWPRSRRRRIAGVSSFGVSGTNAHIVLEEPPTLKQLAATQERPAELFVLSAKHPEALNALAARLSAHLVKHAEFGTYDVAFSLATTRNALEHRLAIAATTRDELLVALKAAAEGQTPAGVLRGRQPRSRGKLAFLFTGQGAQVLGMGRDLHANWLTFREAFDRCVKLFDRELSPSLRDVMWADAGHADAVFLDQTAYTQPALFTLEYALAALWRSFGVEPDVVAGHSIGELVAACIAGVFSLEDAVKLVAARGRLMQELPTGGAMISIAAPEAEVAAAISSLTTNVAIAAVNGPEQVVIAGVHDTVHEIAASFAARGIRTKALQVSHAFHSPLMDPMLEAFAQVANAITYHRPSIALVSNLSGKLVTDDVVDPAYWVRHVREAVRFADGVQAAHEAGVEVFVEVGPKPVLLGMIPACLSEAKPLLVPSLRAGRESTSILEALGAFWSIGGAVNWAVVFPSDAKRVALPTYPWQRERYWYEAPVRLTTSVTQRGHTSGHPLIGEERSVSTQVGMRLWETTIELTRLPWLRDHQVQGSVVFPGAAYLEMALATGSELFGHSFFSVVDVAFVQMMALAGESVTAVQVVTTEEQPGRVRFQVASRVSGETHTPWGVHARAMLRRTERAAAPARVEIASIRNRLRPGVSPTEGYATLSAMGIHYGPAFQGVLELWQGEGEALGRVSLPRAAGGGQGYRLHPALLDACFQLMGGVFADGDESAPWVPVKLGAFQLYHQAIGEVWCHARLVSSGPTSGEQRSADLQIVDAAGVVVAEMVKLTARRLSASGLRHKEDEWLLDLSWEPSPVPAPKIETGRFVLLGQGGSLGAALRVALQAKGHEVAHRDVFEPDVTSISTFLNAVFEGRAPTAVVHLGNLDVDAVLDPEIIDTALARGCDDVLATVQALAALSYRDAPRLWILTRGAQAVGEADVAVVQSPVLGLSRTIAIEHAELRCARIDLDGRGPAEDVDAVVAELLADDMEEEVAYRGGERCVARLVQRATETTRKESVEPAGERPFRLAMDEPGVLERLVLRSLQRKVPGPGEVEITVETAGINFVDVLLALGVMPNDTAGEGNGSPLFGGECAGRIVAIGEGVEGFSLGQTVVALTGGGMASHVTTPASLVVPRPIQISAIEAAAIPVAYTTAYYALEKVAHLKAQERVLIHSATGGVGFAAVQWAKHVGAEIYATAGTPEKRAALEAMGIRYVSDSRSDRFVTDILEWTGGEGVDVVLNSLSGDLIGKSFDLLRDHGRFVELGKRDYYANNQLGMQPFLRNLSFALVDLRSMIAKRSEHVRELLQEVLSLVRDGVFTSPPIETFPISCAADAFRKMAQAKHQGKLVLTLEDPDTRIHVPISSRVPIRADASYLITGGLGGLGLNAAGWLAEQGAGHLVLMGRSGAANPEQVAAVEALRARGTRVTIAKADVAVAADVERTIEEIAASGLPLRGVIHAAGVLDDGALMQQNPARFRTVMAPKVRGAFNLHRSTREMPLDFFVLYSSVSGLMGSPGQSNYAAANTFLDALAHHRKAHGLPALCIDWGAFSDVGLAAAQENRGARLVARGMRSISPTEGLVVLDRLLQSDRAQVAVVPLNIRQWVEFYPAAASSKRLSRLVATQQGRAGRATGDRALLDRLAAAEPKSRIKLLQEALKTQASLVLRIPETKLDIEAPLTSLGMDSLMGLELRNRIEAILGLTIPPTLLWTYPTIATSSQHLVMQVGVARQATAAQATESIDAKPAIVEIEHQEQEGLDVATLRARLLELEGSQTEPIAIIGMACRFPGGGSDPEAFWRLLLDGCDAITSVDARWALLGSSVGGDTARWAGLLTEPVETFDAAFFGISPREARSMDPQQRLLLEVAWEALEGAGIVPKSLAETTTGVFVGAYSTDYAQRVLRQPREQQDAYGTTGNLLSIAAGRLSYTLGLQGPCMTVDTACSSSLVALQLGCRSLRARESSIALVGGVSLILSAEMMEGAAYLQALSPDGRCKTFDASANGYVRGEGCGFVVLKRLRDALRDDDHIWALVRGDAVNQDGRSTGLTAPNVRAQEMLITQALENARVEPISMGYVETHGTGTPLGDPIEVEALRTALGKPRADGSRCVLGAVKTNLGHLEGAAGIAGLIKAVLVLEKEQIPRNLHLRTPNPRVRLEGTALTLATEVLPWPRTDRPRFAGVSSFGLSGTNAHVVLQEAPLPKEMPLAKPRPAEMFVLSAKTERALDAAAGRLSTHLRAHPELELVDVAFSLATTRSAFAHRLAVTAATRDELLAVLDEAAAGRTPRGAVRGHFSGHDAPKLAFVFPGHGSQWLGMGRQLFADDPVFHEALEVCDRVIKAEAGFSVLAEISAEERSSQIDRIDIVQPAIFAIEVALAALWQSWGVTPDAVVGHSMGEVAAAHVAGALSLEHAVQIICRRAQLLRRLQGTGSMAMVELSLEQTRAALEGYESRISIAASNSPRSTVICGDPDALEELVDRLDSQGIFCGWGMADVASHGPHMAPLAQELRSLLANVTPASTRVPMFSTVTNERLDGSALTWAYWADNLRLPVRFADVVQGLITTDHRWFVELSPHPILVPSVEEMLRDAGVGLSVGSLRRGQDERASMLASLGALWTRGYPVAWERLFAPGSRKVALPTYPWQRERHWIEVSLLGKTPSTTTNASPANEGERVGDESAPVRALKALPFKDVLWATKPEEQYSLVEQHVAEHLSHVLHLDAARIGRDDDFGVFGMDSLMRLELRNRLEASLGLKLSAAMLQKRRTLSTLAQHLHRACLTALSQGGDTERAGNTREGVLSYQQRVLWFAQYATPHSSASNHSLTVRIGKGLNVSALERAFDRLGERHDALRTTYVLDEAGVTSRIESAPESLFEVTDASSFSPDELSAQIAERTRAPFDLAQGPLMRVHLFRLAPTEHVLLWTLHAVAADAASWPILLGDLSDLTSEAEGNRSLLPPVGSTYAAFVTWQAAMLASAEGERHFEFWKAQLGGPLPVLHLPMARPRPALLSGNAASYDFVLSDELGDQIHALGRRTKTKARDVLLAAFHMLLHRLSGQDDVLVGLPQAARGRKEFGAVVGAFVNPVVVRATFEDCPRFTTLLSHIAKRTSEAIAHQDYPFALLVERLAPPRDPAHAPIFQAMFAFEESPAASLSLGDISVDRLSLPDRAIACELTLKVHESERGFVATLHYATDRFDKATIAQIALSYAILLESIIADPEALVSKLPAVPWLRGGERMPAPPPSIPGTNTPRPEGIVAPVSAIQQTLVTLWRDLLKTETIGIHDDFFALGGTSLLAARLMRAIEANLGRRVPVSRLFLGPTIAALAGELEGYPDEQESCLVTFRRTGSRRPVFIIHGATGTATMFGLIARELGSDQPVHGLQAVGVRADDAEQYTVDAMAERYLTELQRLQPEGPYHLSGYSLGGVIAFEMAQRLTRAGHEVRSLVLLDTPTRATSFSDMDDTRGLLLAAKVWRLSVNADELRALGPERAFSWLAQKLAEIGAVPRGRAEETLRQNMVISQILIQSGTRYVFQPYAGPVTLVRAQDVDEALPFTAADFAWDQFCTGPMDVHFIPGAHLTFLHPEYIDALMQVLRRVFDTATETPELSREAP